MASIYDQTDESLTDAYKYAQLSPSEQIALRQRLAERGVERGVENVMRGGLGLPESASQHRELAGRELKALSQTVAPGTDEFYVQAAAIFRKHNMVAEAETMEQRRNILEIGKAGQHSPTLKLQRDKEALLKQKAGGKPVDAAIAAIDRQLATLGTAPGSKQTDPEFIKLLDSYESAVNAGQNERAGLIKQAIDAWLKAKSKTGADMTEYQKLRLALETAKAKRLEDKDTRKAKADDAAVVSSLQGITRAIDLQLQSAQRLLNHKGLPWIVGPRVGLLGRGAAALSGDAADAHALLLNVQAQTFIQALQDLKATSRVGASGLGQLTEREGDKIQNAKAALDPQQQVPQFKATLQNYIDQLAVGRAAAVQELESVGAEVPALLPPLKDASRPAVKDLAPDAAPKRKLTATRVR